MEAWAASALNGGTFHFEVDGVNVSGPIQVTATGSWYSYNIFQKGGVPLTQGRHVLRLVFDQPGAEGVVADFDFLRMYIDPGTAPSPTPSPLPSPSPSPSAPPTAGAPVRPLVQVNTDYPSQSGALIRVNAGESLQAAIDRAVPGDTIELAAGATFIGNFRLPVKSNPGNRWIVIRTSSLSGIPAQGTRVKPSVHRAAMPKILSPNVEPALSTVVPAIDRSISVPAGAGYYRIVGVEVGLTAGLPLNYGIVRLGESKQTCADCPSQEAMNQVPHHLILDRVYVHGNDTGDVSRCVGLNSGETAVIDSYLSNCHGIGYDTQAIGGWNGPGPYRIENNYLEGAGENVLFGGADPGIPGLVPSDIVIRRNLISRPLSWWPRSPNYAGQNWSVKNLLELKNARRVLIEGNILENHWEHSQAGPSILFTVRNQDGGCSWCAVQDVTFSNNIVRHVGAGINILGTDNLQPSQRTYRIRIENNLFYDVNGNYYTYNGATGRFLLILDSPSDVQVVHNTVLNANQAVYIAGGQSSGFVFTDNIVHEHIWGESAGFGQLVFDLLFPGIVFRRNVMTDSSADMYSRYNSAGEGNLFPATMNDVGFTDMAGENFCLSSSSPYQGRGVNCTTLYSTIGTQ